MLYTTQLRTRVFSLFGAVLMTVLVNGSLLLGVDNLAGAHSSHQLAMQQGATHVAL